MQDQKHSSGMSRCGQTRVSYQAPALTALREAIVLVQQEKHAYCDDESIEFAQGGFSVSFVEVGDSVDLQIPSFN